MELDEFVRKTLEQIISGVRAAGAHAKAKGAYINDSPTSNVEFDVALTTTEGSEKKGNAGISVAGFGVGGQGKTELTNSVVSRVKFNVRVTLPSSQRAAGDDRAEEF